MMFDMTYEDALNKAATVLKENGMTLDAISASNMRHVLSGISGKVVNTLHQSVIESSE